jgi:hypothetical protein
LKVTSSKYGFEERAAEDDSDRGIGVVYDEKILRLLKGPRKVPASIY